MHIPLWLFLVSLVLALTAKDMASLFLKRAVPTNALFTRIYTPLPLALQRNIPSFLLSNPAYHSSHTPPQLPHSKQFSTTNTNMATKSQPFLDQIAARRTIYALKKESTISDKQIQDIIEQVVLHVPSSFNSQSTRVLLLVKEEHDTLWEFAKEALRGIVTDEQWKSTEQRLNGFQAAYGTVLFFESRSAVQTMQDKFAIYAERFPGWATQSDAMHQFAIWTALEAEGLGANLQHYNPLIDAKVAEKWGVPQDWELNAQLVFGTPAGGPGQKTFVDLKERIKVFGV